jgi:hypothetical protein
LIGFEAFTQTASLLELLEIIVNGHMTRAGAERVTIGFLLFRSIFAGFSRQSPKLNHWDFALTNWQNLANRRVISAFLMRERAESENSSFHL